MGMNLLKWLQKNKTLSDFVFLAFGQYGGMFCNIIFSIFLTRLLSPSDFGIIASLLFLLNFFNWICEWGWEQALMAHKEIPLETAASTHLLLRFFLGAIPFFTFNILLKLMGQEVLAPDKTLIILAIVLAYWVEKVGLTYKTILERNSLLKSIAFFEFFSSVASFAAAFIAAWYGFGALSLAVQRLVEKALLLTGYVWASPWKFGLNFEWSVLKIFFKTFGVASWVGGVFGLAIYDFMPFLLGRLVGMHQAGLYAKAFSLATFPLMLTVVFNRITAPLYTKNQFEAAKLRRYFVKAQVYKMVILFPLQLALAICAPFWILTVFGTRWSELVVVYQVMACYGLARAFFDDVPPLIALGFKKPWELTKNQIFQSIFIIIFAPISVIKFGALGAAVVMSLSMILSVLFFWRVVFGFVRCTTKRFFALARSALLRPGVFG
jgi:teichuronic acid exporter